jgi:hypothetical protein
MLAKRLFSVLLLLFATPLVFAGGSMEWHSLGQSKNNGISGIANFDEDRFLVAYDRKKPYEPRLGILTWKNDSTLLLTRLDWCDEDNFPIDLEAIAAIPNHPKQFLLLESKGRVTRIQFDDENACEVTARFDLPTAMPNSNMEGLALHCFEKDCALTWGERGSDKIPGKLSWAKFDVENSQVSQDPSTVLEFHVPYPKTHQRSIADIAIDSNGQVWVSATSDPGDEGPFQSAIYYVGAFTHQKNQIVWQATKKITPAARYDIENVKIEGIVFTPTALIMGSEDENLGGKIATKPVKELMGIFK